MTKLIEFRAENTRVLKAVRITPDGNMVILGGRNGSGKTTVLDDIELLFAGAGSDKMPAVPIRTGQTSGRTSGKLSNGITLEREWSATGTRLIARDADGKKLPGGPQAVADKFYSSVAFDPLEFADKMEPRRQAEVLRKLVGLDFAELDAKRASIYAEREDGGRDLNRRKGQLATMPEVPGAPDAEVSVAELVQEKDAAEAHNRNNQRVRGAYVAAQEAEQRASIAVSKAKAALEESERQHAEARAKTLTAANAMEALKDKETTPLIERIKGAEDINRTVRARKEREKVATDVDRMESERRALTAKLEAIDAEKAKALAEAKWPVDGLGFSGDGVTYQGLPFAQASKAQRYGVSVAIGAMLNPELPVMLIRDASALDEDAMALLAKLAEEKGQQLWIERVGKNDVGAIILEDGEVAGVVTEPGKVGPIETAGK
jgi:energy-coupling factor transporter ATP-binding protein EcfA2